MDNHEDRKDDSQNQDSTNANYDDIKRRAEEEVISLTVDHVKQLGRRGDLQLDKNRLDDSGYLVSVALENWNILVQTFHVIISYKETFLLEAKNAANAGHWDVAVVLVATAIEHLLNEYIRKILTSTSTLSDDQILKIQKQSIDAKLDWLFPLISEHELSEVLVKRIRKISELRNSLVHYRGAPIPFLSDIEDAIGGRLREDDMRETLLRVPEDLRGELETILKAVTSEGE